MFLEELQEQVRQEQRDESEEPTEASRAQSNRCKTYEKRSWDLTRKSNILFDRKNQF